MARADPLHTRQRTRRLPSTASTGLTWQCPGGIVKSADEYRRNGFLRYHLTLQAFFDAAAEVETTFGASEVRA